MVLITLYVKQQETQMYRTVFWTVWERVRAGWYGKMALKHVHYHMWNKSPVRVQCMIQDAQGWCTGMTQRDGMGRELGGGFRMGNTCTPMADSSQCMAKPIQCCKVKKKKTAAANIIYPSGIPASKLCWSLPLLTSRTFTNKMPATMLEPQLQAATDPRTDHQLLTEAPIWTRPPRLLWQTPLSAMWTRPSSPDNNGGLWVVLGALLGVWRHEGCWPRTFCACVKGSLINKPERSAGSPLPQRPGRNGKEGQAGLEMLWRRGIFSFPAHRSCTWGHRRVWRRRYLCLPTAPGWRQASAPAMTVCGPTTPTTGRVGPTTELG